MAFLEPCEDKKVLSGQLIVTLIWVAITAIGVFLRPSPAGHGTHQQLGLPPCASVLLFDRPCPGCGLTTSWTATIHGQLTEAFRAHPIGPVLYLGLTAIAFINVWAYFKRLRVDTSGRKWTLGIVVGGAIFFGFGLARFVISDRYSAPNEVGNYLEGLARQSKPKSSSAPMPQ
jgi:hypothetical protein